MMFSVVDELAFSLLSGNVMSSAALPSDVDFKNIDSMKNEVIDAILGSPQAKNRMLRREGVPGGFKA